MPGGQNFNGFFPIFTLQFSMMIMLRYVPVLLLCLCLSGCLAIAGTGGILAAQDRSVGDGVTDISAAQAVRNGLKLDRRYDFSFVRVRAVEGLILMTGPVANMQARQTAEKIAHSRTKAKRIENAITISSRAPSRGNDSWLAAQARSRLTAAYPATSINLAIEVTDGILYLMGRTRTPQELGVAAEVVARVRGIRQVVVLAEVVPTQ